MLEKTIVIGVMLVPIKERHRERYLEELLKLKKKHPEMVLAYLNWQSKFDDLVDDHQLCIVEEGCKDIVVPCYKNSVFDAIVDIANPEMGLLEIKDSDEFAVFEEMCEVIISPIINESVSSKFCTLEFAKELLHAHTHRKTLDVYTYDNDGRIILKFKSSFNPGR